MDSSHSRHPGSLPEYPSDPDPEWTEYLAWQDHEVAAGRDPGPGPGPDPGPWPPDMRDMGA